MNKNEIFVVAEPVPGVFEDEDEDEEVVVDGEVDEGDVHIKPVSRRPIPLVYLVLHFIKILVYILANLCLSPFQLVNNVCLEILIYIICPWLIILQWN